MKITRIEIQHYKAFREAEIFEIDGKNVLIYGNNGSGKTSFAHALQSLIQSSAKTKIQLEDALDPLRETSHVNIHKPQNDQAYVRLQTDGGDKFDYSWMGNTVGNPALQLANQVSDFLNYRVLFRFFDTYQDSDNPDIYPIISNEFMPYWTDSARNQTYPDWIEELDEELRHLYETNARRDSRAYKNYHEKLQKFNDSLLGQLITLAERANALLKQYLSPDDPIEIGFILQRGADANKETGYLSPVVFLTLRYDGRTIHHPHTFLNEARLTALALAIRLGSFADRPKAVSDFKILVLDDLLISLDMSLRMKVINVLRDSYPDYQIFILTHDKGFYNFLRQALELDEGAWKCFEMYESLALDGKNKPFVQGGGLDYLQKAEHFLDLRHKDLEISALFLRKKAEELIRIYYDPDLEKYTRFTVLEKLATALTEAKNKRDKESLKAFRTFLDKVEKDEATLDLLLAEPFHGDGTLDPRQVHLIEGVRRDVITFIKNHAQERKQFQVEHDELMALISKIDQARAIVMNPGAHQDDIPIYEQELREALVVLRAFQKKVKDKNLYS